METPLKSILLVEDDEATNFLHQLVIKRAGVAENIHVAINGKKALEYINAAVAGEHPMPDLILLDINMPIMNGWEFLDEYRRLPAQHKEKMKLVVLTASLNPADETRALAYAEVFTFKFKPLTKDILLEIVANYFGKMVQP